MTHTYIHCETQLTREIREGKANPSRNMHNRKPYRTARQKADARKDAVLCGDGAYRSDTPYCYHSAPRKGA